MTRPLAATALAASLICSAAPQGARAQDATCVPSQLASTSYPMLTVKVRVNGRGPYTFFIDTGATVTIVNTALARRLRLESLPASVQGIGAGGNFSTRASVASIDVGGVREDRVLVATYDLSQINAAVGPLDGGLGYNFLKHYRVTIDYPAQRVCFGR
ncbi:MAG TPA: retropepsin-like aspartic protease [Candidatus Elarobacter sp.]|jgi:predicted aspartyl protease